MASSQRRFSLLQRVKNLKKNKVSDPIMEQKFDYQPLDASRPEIRLLDLRMSEEDDNIQCELLTTSLDQAPTYEALSYTWGSPDDKLPITLCSRSFEVAHNLYGALQHLRKEWSLGQYARRTSHRRLWIDAVCINQEDIEERNRQVRLIWFIYAKAARVLVWLGEEQDNSDLGMEMVRLLNLRFELQSREMLESILSDIEGSAEAQETQEAPKEDGERAREEAQKGTQEAPQEDQGKVPEEIQEAFKENRGKARGGPPEGTQGGTQEKALEIDHSGGGVQTVWMSKDRPQWSGNMMDVLGHAGPFSPSHNATIAPTRPRRAMTEADIENITRSGDLRVLNEEEMSMIPFDLLMRLHGSAGGEHLDPQDPAEWVAFQKLMDRPWWRRIWVVQEIAAAHDSIWVGCGSVWLTWQTFLGAALTIQEHKDNPFVQSLGRLGAGSSEILHKSKFRVQTDGRLDKWGGLLNLLFETRAYCASDPRDKVFALLGFTPSIGVVPDYSKTAEEVYEDVVKSSIKSTGTLMLLFLNPHQKRLQLPSWVPDFSLELPDDAYNVCCPLGHFGADGNNWQNVGAPSPGCVLDPTDARGQLTVSGFTYDTPLILGTTWDGTPEERQSKVFEIIAEYEKILHETDSARFPNLVGNHRRESFWRTLIWNANKQDRYPAPDNFGTFFSRLVTEKAFLHNIAEEIKTDNQHRVIPRGEPALYYEAFLRHGFKRRFFIHPKATSDQALLTCSWVILYVFYLVPRLLLF